MTSRIVDGNWHDALMKPYIYISGPWETGSIVSIHATFICRPLFVLAAKRLGPRRFVAGGQYQV